MFASGSILERDLDRMSEAEVARAVEDAITTATLQAAAEQQIVPFPTPADQGLEFVVPPELVEQLDLSDLAGAVLDAAGYESDKSPDYADRYGWLKTGRRPVPEPGSSSDPASVTTLAIYRHEADDEDEDDLDPSDGEENKTLFSFWQGPPDAVPSGVPAETLVDPVGWELVAHPVLEEEPAAAEPAARPAADAEPPAAVPLLGVLD